MFSVEPAVLKRYAEISRLLVKYGRADLVSQSGLENALNGEEPLVTPRSAANPIDLARDLERLGPTFVKLGQLLSTRADLLPEPYLEALSKLQDKVGPVGFPVIQKTLQDELGPWMDSFVEFDQKPVASASLGQVHRAVLRDGMVVAVKVQRPGIRQQVQLDLRALVNVAALLDHHTAAGRQLRLSRIVESLRHCVIQELNYVQEAENCRVLRESLTDYPHLHVPATVTPLCTGKVLTMEFIRGIKITELDDAALQRIDRRGLARELFDCYLEQVLVGRMFHADPHPGNLLLTAEGNIALVDLGMVVRMPDELQRQLLKLLLTISEARGDETARIAEKIAEDFEDYHQTQFRHRIAQLVMEHHSQPVEDLEVGRIVMQIQATAGRCGVLLPEEITMLGKTLMNLDRVIDRLDPELNPNREIRECARRLMRKQTSQQVSTGKLYQSFMESSEFVLQLPDRMNRIMETIADNQLKLHLDAIDERELIKGFQKIANRITVGIILASIIVGASLMMRQETSMTLFGYPALAVIFFIIAATLGLILAYQALRKDIS
jgi:predicted unusual protein kinase regulating ubiquinone biosynthesis (AarF/ABC1/UbiB family)